MRKKTSFAKKQHAAGLWHGENPAVIFCMGSIGWVANRAGGTGANSSRRVGDLGGNKNAHAKQSPTAFFLCVRRTGLFVVLLPDPFLSATDHHGFARIFHILGDSVGYFLKKRVKPPRVSENPPDEFLYLWLSV